MLWLALKLPHFSLQALTQGVPAGTPLAVLDPQQRVLQVNAPAQCVGIHPGDSAPAARAAGLVCLHQDHRAETQTLKHLADWLYSFSSRVVLDPPQHLLLEVGASLDLFGGLTPLRRRLLRELRHRGFHGQVGVAPTPLAARVLAASATVVQHPADLTTALAPQTLADLPLAATQRRMLHDLGIHTLGPLCALPRADIAQRGGPTLVTLLDRLLGRCPDPRQYYQPPPQFQGRLACPSISNTQALAFPAQRLLGHLQDWLAQRQGGVQQLNISLELERGEPLSLQLCLQRPGRDASHWLSLLRLRWAELRLPTPVVALGLRVADVQPLCGATAPLFPHPGGLQQALEAVLAQLRARLGDHAVRGLSCYADHRPERAWCLSDPGVTETLAITSPRPLWLLAQPQPLNGPVAGLSHGPERIETGWWDGQDISRDYWRGQGSEGEGLWVFQERRGAHRWFLQGLFA